MKESKINALMVEPGKHPVITTLENDLDSLQKAVSIGASYQGLIEIITIRPSIVNYHYYSISNGTNHPDGILFVFVSFCIIKIPILRKLLMMQDLKY